MELLLFIITFIGFCYYGATYDGNKRPRPRHGNYSSYKERESLLVGLGIGGAFDLGSFARGERHNEVDSNIIEELPPDQRYFYDS